MKVHGPYTINNDRLIVRIVHDDGHKQTQSYPRYLMEQHLGRKLTEDETVDHDDSDYTNNDISNLKLMSLAANAEKDVVKAADVFVKCSWCDTLFQLSKEQRKRSMKNCAGPFCSRSCSGKYGKAIQMGTIQKLSRTDFTMTYYKDSGAPLSEAQKNHFL